MTLRDAVLAEDRAAVRRLVEAGADPTEGLWVACTPAMLGLLLELGADAAVEHEGRSVLDAIAREGQLEMAQHLLRVAPGLATEARALMAADHPQTEALIRDVARGDDVDGRVTPSASSLRVTRVAVRQDECAPRTKSASRFHTSPAPQVIPTDWADVGDDVVFAGPRGGYLAFGKSTRFITEQGEVELDAPAPSFPWEHAFDEAGEHFFFAYGQARLLGVDVRGKVLVDETLPGAGWGTAIARLPGEPEGGHAYPARLCVVGHWLACVSLERIHFVPFGPYADVPMKWFTCQLGTCAVPLLGGRAVLIGARAGGGVFGIDGDRLERLAAIEPTLFEGAPNALHGHLRMALRVLGQGHDDPRALTATANDRGTRIRATGMGGMSPKSVFVPGLKVDPSELEETWPTRPEPTDAWETPEGEIRVRVQPIGRDDLRSYRLEGVEVLWDAAFGEVEVDEDGSFCVLRAPIPRPYPAPHKDMGTLSYPEVGPAGYAFGHKVSRQPGKWNSYVVDSEGVHAFEPHWFSGVTYSGFHWSEPRLIAGTGRQAIEVDLVTRKWDERKVGGPIRGVAFFGDGLAVHAGSEVLLLDSLHAEPRRVLKATVTRNANMVSFHAGRVLWVPVEDRSVLLALRDDALVVLGVLRLGATGKHETPEGDWLALQKGAAWILGVEKGIAEAEVLAHDDLAAIAGPSLDPPD